MSVLVLNTCGWAVGEIQEGEVKLPFRLTPMFFP